MKKFTIITLALVLFLTPTFSFAGAIEWLNGNTYIYGHDVTGVVKNWVALTALLAPLTITLAYTAIVMVPFKKLIIKRG